MSRLFMRPGLRAGVVSVAMAVSVALLGGAAAMAQSPSAPAAPMGSMAPAPSMAPLPDPSDPGFVAGTVAVPRHIPIQVNDNLLFAPNVISIAEGETITFDIINVGTATHEFKVGHTMDVLGDLPAAPEVADITAGTTKSLTYTFEGAGPFVFACHEPGHLEHGMIGHILVQGPDVPAVGTVEAPRQVLVTMDDTLHFMPADIPVKAGETVEFILQNTGTVVHEFQVGDADMVAADNVDGAKVVEVDGIDPMHVMTTSYTFAADGNYAYACHEPGHYEAGMHGTITVTP